MFSFALYDCEKKKQHETSWFSDLLHFFRTGAFTAVRGRMEHSKLECDSGNIGQ